MIKDNKVKKKILGKDIYFIILLCIASLSIIWFLGNSLDSRELVINSIGNQTIDDINLIMAVTDNAINKIYNILVVSTIFFTVIIVLITLFH